MYVYILYHLKILCNVWRKILNKKASPVILETCLSLFMSANSLSFAVSTSLKNITLFCLITMIRFFFSSIKYLIYVSETAKATNKNAMESIDHKGQEKQWKTAGLYKFFFFKNYSFCF